MDPDRPASPFVLTLGALPRHVAWVRAFAAAIATAFDVSPAEVSEVKLVVAELASCVAATDPGAEMELRVAAAGNRLVFSIEPWRDGAMAADGLDPWDIVAALFEDARIDHRRAVFTASIPEGS